MKKKQDEEKYRAQEETQREIARLEETQRQRYEQERMSMTTLMQNLQTQIREQNKRLEEMMNRTNDSSSSGCSIM